MNKCGDCRFWRFKSEATRALGVCDSPKFNEYVRIDVSRSEPDIQKEVRDFGRVEVDEKFGCMFFCEAARKEISVTDKELREKLAEYFAQLGFTTLEQARGKIGEFVYYTQADAILVLVEKAGYRTIRGEPPILSDLEIGDALDLEQRYNYPCSDGSEITTLDCHPVAEAQRKADIAFYTASSRAETLPMAEK